jgi:hypothetical protein
MLELPTPRFDCKKQNVPSALHDKSRNHAGQKNSTPAMPFAGTL